MLGSKKRSRLVALAVAVPVVLGACSGGGGGDNAANNAPKKVTAATYAKGICTTMQTWLDAIQSGGQAIQDLPSDASITDRQTALATYLDGVVAATGALVDGAKAVGIPDVDGGADFAGKIEGAFEDAKTALEDARAQVDQLPTDDPTAFQNAAQGLGGSVQTSVTAIGGSISTLSQPDLDQAFSSEPACTNLGIGSG